MTQYKVGDILGFSSYSWSGVIINLGTYAIPFFGYSHVGIVGEYKGQKVLYESTSLCPQKCLIQGKIVSGVQAHEISERVSTYYGKVYKHSLVRGLGLMDQDTLNTYLQKWIGANYDTIGALRSAGVLLSWFESKIRPEDLTSLFCSELVAAALREVGFSQLENASRWSPNNLIRYCRKECILSKPERLR